MYRSKVNVPVWTGPSQLFCTSMAKLGRSFFSVNIPLVPSQTMSRVGYWLSSVLWATGSLM